MLEFRDNMFCDYRDLGHKGTQESHWHIVTFSNTRNICVKLIPVKVYSENVSSVKKKNHGGPKWHHLDQITKLGLNLIAVFAICKKSGIFW